MSDEQPDIRHGEPVAKFTFTDKRGTGIRKPADRMLESSTPDDSTVRIERPQTGTVARISDYMVNWLQRAFANAALGERVGWDFSMIVANSPGGQAPMWLIYAEIDGPSIGQPIPGAIMAPMGASFEEFQKGCGELVESLRRKRTEMLQQVPMQMPNGHPLLGGPQ